MDGVAAIDFAPFADSDELAEIHRFARGFPFAVHAHALELRLRAGIRHVDYAACLRDEERTLRSVRKGLGNAGSALVSGSYFQRFLEAWSAEDSAIRRLLPLVWLEYDRPDGEFTRTPALFLALEGDLGEGETSSAFDQTLGLLYGSAETDRKRRAVDRVRAAIPESARIRHLGAAPSRHPDFMRLVVEGLNTESLPSSLKKLGWTGDIAYLSQVTTQLRDRAGISPELIDLDLIDTIQPKLGLEFLLVGGNAPEDEGVRLLSLLLENGWCSREKGEAISRWLKWTTRESVDMEPLAFWDKLYHVKLTLTGPAEPGATSPEVECKAYWGVWAGPKPDALQQFQAAIQRHRR